MKKNKWSELRKKNLTPERDAKVKAEVIRIVLKMSLREVRKRPT